MQQVKAFDFFSQRDNLPAYNLHYVVLQSTWVLISTRKILLKFHSSSFTLFYGGLTFQKFILLKPLIPVLFSLLSVKTPSASCHSSCTVVFPHSSVLVLSSFPLVTTFSRLTCISPSLLQRIFCSTLYFPSCIHSGFFSLACKHSQISLITKKQVSWPPVSLQLPYSVSFP